MDSTRAPTFIALKKLAKVLYEYRDALPIICPNDMEKTEERIQALKQKIEQMESEGSKGAYHSHAPHFAYRLDLESSGKRKASALASAAGIATDDEIRHLKLLIERYFESRKESDYKITQHLGHGAGGIPRLD